MIPDKYKNRIIDNLKEKLDEADSTKKRHILLKKYLPERIQQFKLIMENKRELGFHSIEELVLELIQDMELVNKHIKSIPTNNFDK